jgi:hypothetical protein
LFIHFETSSLMCPLAKQKAAGRSAAWLRRMSSVSHHMTKGRHSAGFGAAARSERAHVQNCPAAVIGAWYRILIKTLLSSTSS